MYALGILKNGFWAPLEQYTNIPLDSIFAPIIYLLLDIDECKKSPCEQECKNTIGSYTCSCRTGYVKNTKDATKCTSKEWFHYYYENNNFIQSLFSLFFIQQTFIA